MSDVILKKCSRCQEFKRLNRFYKDASRKDGREHKCVDCRKVQSDTYATTMLFRAAQCRHKIRFWQNELKKAENAKAL